MIDYTVIYLMLRGTSACEQRFHANLVIAICGGADRCLRAIFRVYYDDCANAAEGKPPAMTMGIARGPSDLRRFLVGEPTRTDEHWKVKRPRWQMAMGAQCLWCLAYPTDTMACLPIFANISTKESIVNFADFLWITSDTRTVS